MIGKLLSGFKFKPVEKKKQRVSSAIKRKSNKKVYCKCKVTEEGKYYASFIEKDETGTIYDRVLPFSENSYNLKGKTIVFTKDAKAYGRIAAIYRTKEQAIHFPGTSEQYTPFKKNWIYGGYIVIIDGIEYFDVIDTCGNYNSSSYLLDS